MESTDLEEVRKLDAEVFSEYGAGVRTRENVTSCLQLNPNGCFVAADTEIVGYIFSRIWGKVGWIGTFGVTKDYRGKDIGKSLLQRAVGALQQSGCLIIGLETMPESTYNIGFYLRMGFRLTPPRLNLRRDVHCGEATMAAVEEVRADELDFVAELSTAVLQGLDYTAEVKSCLGNPDFTVGKFTRNGVYGFAVLRGSSITEGERLGIHNLLLNRIAKVDFNLAFDGIESMAHNLGRKSVSVPCSCDNPQALDWLLERNYRIRGLSQRMLLCGQYSNLNGIDLSRWAM
jgi:ribosomal protein S18 acetylase RimI-like enzyme